MSKFLRFGIGELIVAIVIVCATVFTITPAFAKTSTNPPRSCLLAIDAAEDGFIVAADFVGGVGDYVAGLRSAAQIASNAGGTNAAVGVFLQTQATLLENLTTKAQIANDDLTVPAQRFNLYKTKCRAGK